MRTAACRPDGESSPRTVAIAPAGSMLASAIPERLTRCGASTRPSGSTTFACPGKRSRPKLPHWLADAHTTWFSNARAWSSRLKWRTCRSRPSARPGPRGYRPGRQRRDDHRAVQRQLAGRLGEDLVVTDQHPHAADRRVEGGESLARDVGVALGRRQVDLAVMPEHAVAAQAHGAGVDAVACRPRCSPRTQRSRRRLASGGPSPRRRRRAREEGRSRYARPRRDRLLQVPARARLGEHDQLRASRACARHRLLDALEARLEIAAERARRWQPPRARFGCDASPASSDHSPNSGQPLRPTGQRSAGADRQQVHRDRFPPWD